MGRGVWVGGVVRMLVAVYRIKEKNYPISTGLSFSQLCNVITICAYNGPGYML